MKFALSASALSSFTLPFAALLATATPALAAPGDAYPPINPKVIERVVRDITDDSFEGRAPGGAGEQKTLDYIIAKFKAAGAEPGGVDGGWTQPVPLQRTQLGEPTRLGVMTHQGFIAWTRGEQVYLSTQQPVDRAVIENAPLVFVGYGVSAPERGWDDYKGVDLTGKVAVYLVNDPDFDATPDEPVANQFGGRTMTYYGRWTYKFEEAARRGAIGALIIHDTPGAGYGWNVVRAPGGENFDRVRTADGITTLRLQGWIAGEAAKTLFAQSGLDLASLRIRARDRNFTPVTLQGASFSADIPVTRETLMSHNVIAKITGTSRKDEVVMLGAHWDAYGKGAPDAQGRVYRAGAIDDGIGIAALLEMAHVIKAGPPLERTLVFAAWTAEERGLIGSETYAAAPLYPLEKTAANLTIDVLQTAGRARDVILIGKGQNELEDDLARLAARQGRVVTPDAAPERGLFYRADHFPLAKRGVPVLLMMGLAGGPDLVEGGRAAGEKWVNDYTANCYHQPCDAWDESWNLEGAIEDIELVRQLATNLASSTRWPEWKSGSEFKATRDASHTARP